jgi:hypothetical protein
MGMRRTRKWAFVAQEAKRLADLGLSGYAIAKRLDVAESSVSRWVKAGKLVLRSGKGGDLATERGVIAARCERYTPEQWAATVRADYALDATDDQLVTMAESALLLARDPGAVPTFRLQAMGRFQAIVKQLALVARAAAEAEAVPTVSRQALRVVRRSTVDPREALLAVSE